MKNKEPIGIVILNFRTWEKTLSCVESIYNTYLGAKEIVIVDNQSPNDSFLQLKNKYTTNEYKDVTVIQTGKNGGFSYGNNYGFDYIVKHFPDITKIIITNNDIIFKEDTIEKLVNAFNYSDKVVMTAPSVYNVTGERTNAPWKKKPTVIQEIGLKSFNGCAYEWFELNENLPVYMVCGCCFAVNRDKFLSIDRFDENVFLYNEENIFSVKIAEKRLQIIYCPDADIIHDHGSTTGNSNVFVDKEYVKSTLYFMKHYEHLSNSKIYLLRWFYALRIITKKVLCKYDNSQNLFKAIREIFKYKI